jgi:hypothetical protein
VDVVPPLIKLALVAVHIIWETVHNSSAEYLICIAVRQIV